MLAGPSLGGQLINTNFIENWPSFKSIKGSNLMFLFYKQLLFYNIEIYNDSLEFINFLNKPFTVIGVSNSYLCDFINISTGSFHKVFDLKNQFKYIGKNISNCSTCDGNFYLKKIIIVIGGSDSCFENLINLINISKILILINRNKIFKANFNLINKFFLKIKTNIFFKLNFFILEFLGDDFLVLYIKIKNFFNFNINLIFTDGLFLFIGNISNSKIFLGQLKIFKNFILTKKSYFYNYSLTSINYVFSSGDVQDFLYKQALTSSASGCFVYFDFLNYYKKLF